MPFHEPDVPELLERNRERLTFTLDANDVAGCELLFVCVDTPPTHSGDADLSRVWSVVEELPALEGRPILVMKSTVPVGTGDEGARTGSTRAASLTSATSRTRSSSPKATPSTSSCTRTASSSARFEPSDGDAVAALYEGLDAPIVRCDVNSAEMIKLAANAFLMTRISFINEIANVCEATGADVVKVAEGVGLDHRLGPHFLRAGIGYGGSCFPKDSLALKQLASNSGYHFQLLSAVIEVNELQKRRVIGKLEKHLGVALGQEGRAARARVQAGHRRHARGAVDRAREPPARGRRGGARLGSGRRRAGAAARASRSRARCWTRCAAPTRP